MEIHIFCPSFDTSYPQNESRFGNFPFVGS